jgi:hypothetical protein
VQRGHAPRAPRVKRAAPLIRKCSNCLTSASGSFDRSLAWCDLPCAPLLTGDDSTLRFVYCWRCCYFGPTFRSGSCRRAALPSCCRSVRWACMHPCLRTTCTTTWGTTPISKIARLAALPVPRRFPNRSRSILQPRCCLRLPLPQNRCGWARVCNEATNLAGHLLSFELIFLTDGARLPLECCIRPLHQFKSVVRGSAPEIFRE